jgi:methylated-DNA-[protein]-cysteine S-methyltransferase
MKNSHHLQSPCGFSENDLIAEALGDTSPQGSVVIQQHLIGCPTCAALLAQYRSLVSQLQACSVFSPSQGLQEARRLLNERLASPPRPRLVWEIWHSPVGDIRLGRTDKGVALVEFVRPGEEDLLPVVSEETFTVERNPQAVTDLMRTLEGYFNGTRRHLEWTVDDTLMRSDFQRVVLRATTAVPYGSVVTYQSIAEAIGQPKAVRAVAQALRYNPIPIHIPCHRVIGSDGSLTGYAGNLVDLKRQILAIEGIPVVETARGLTIAKEQMYVGWQKDRYFCRPKCPSLKEQTAGDRTFIPSRVRAEEMGYQPCDVCRPNDPVLF